MVARLERLALNIKRARRFSFGEDASRFSPGTGQLQHPDGGCIGHHSKQVAMRIKFQSMLKHVEESG